MKIPSQSARWFTTLSVLFLSATFVWPQTREPVSGSIGTNATWSTDTMDVMGDVIVEDGATLTIDPGVLVAFDGFYSLRIKGRLLAVGTAADTIRFERFDSLGWSNFASTGGGWNGIIIDNTDGGMAKGLYLLELRGPETYKVKLFIQ